MQRASRGTEAEAEDTGREKRRAASRFSRSHLGPLGAAEAAAGDLMGGTRSRGHYKWGDWDWSSEKCEVSGGSEEKRNTLERCSEAGSDLSVQSRGFGTPGQVNKSAGEVTRRLEAEERDHRDQRRGGRKGEDSPCPSWGGKDLSEWPEKRLAIDRWSRMTAITFEKQGETLLLHLPKEAARRQDTFDQDRFSTQEGSRQLSWRWTPWRSLRSTRRPSSCWRRRSLHHQGPETRH